MEPGKEPDVRSEFASFFDVSKTLFRGGRFDAAPPSVQGVGLDRSGKLTRHLAHRRSTLGTEA